MMKEVSVQPFRLMYIVALLSLLLGSNSLHASVGDIWRTADSSGNTRVNVYFFWSPLCPHCTDARGYLNSLPESYPWMNLQSYNVVDYPDNALLYHHMALEAGGEASSVPAFFICGQQLTGWDSPEGMGNTIVELAQACRQDPDLTRDEVRPNINLPLLGTIGVDDYSLPLFTLIIAGLDAFNPCAFFVLLFLLSLMVHARSRLRMFLIGSIFVLISGLVYFLFMSAWLNFFMVVGNVAWITLLAGIVATLIGVLAIKDFLFTFKGPSLTISSSSKSRLFERMKALLSADSMPAMISGTVLLALVANAYELLCTAGFPMVYTRTLTLYELDTVSYYLYLILYNLVYVAPLMAIVLVFTMTLGARKLTLAEGRLLKLLSGTMMLGLGTILIINPAWLNNIYTGIGLLLVAVVVTLMAKTILIGREE